MRIERRRSRRYRQYLVTSLHGSWSRTGCGLAVLAAVISVRESSIHSQRDAPLPCSLVSWPQLPMGSLSLAQPPATCPNSKCHECRPSMSWKLMVNTCVGSNATFVRAYCCRHHRTGAPVSQISEAIKDTWRPIEGREQRSSVNAQ